MDSSVGAGIAHIPVDTYRPPLDDAYLYTFQVKSCLLKLPDFIPKASHDPSAFWIFKRVSLLYLSKGFVTPFNCAIHIFKSAHNHKTEMFSSVSATQRKPLCGPDHDARN